MSKSERVNLKTAPQSRPAKQKPKSQQQSRATTLEEFTSPVQQSDPQHSHQRPDVRKAIASKVFLALVSLTLLTPLVLSQHLAQRFATSEAYFFRIMVEVTFPLYVYLTLTSKHDRPILRQPLTLALFAALAINMASALAGENVTRSIWGNLERMGGLILQAHLLVFYLYILMLAEISRSYLRRFLSTAIAVAGGTALYGILVKFHFLRGYDATDRISSTLGNPSFFASFLITAIFLTLLFCLGRYEQGRWVRILCLAIVLMELYCVFLTQTRGAVAGLIVASVIAVLFYSLLTKDKRKMLYGGIALISVIVGTALTFRLHSLFPEKSIFHRVFTLMNASTEFRLAQWRVALRAIREHPLLGVGPENYYVVANRYTESIGYWVDKPHNYALEVLTTAGIIGFVAYAATLTAAVWGLSRALRTKIIVLSEFCILLGGLVAYSVQSLFLFDTVASAVLFAAFLAVVGTLWRQPQEKPHSEKDWASAPRWPVVPAVVVFSCLAMALTIYTVNVSGIRIAAALEDGDRWSLVNPQRAATDFEAAKHMPLDFDPVQVACEYSDFAESLTLVDPTWRRGIGLQNVIGSTLDMLQGVSIAQNDPRPYDSMARLYLALATMTKSSLDPRADVAIDKALALAPGKQHLLYTKARVKVAQGDVGAAKLILDKLLQRFPYDLATQIEMARLYWYRGTRA